MNQLEVVEEERTVIETHKKAMGLWLTKQARRFSLIDPARAEEFKFDKNGSLQANFITFLKHVGSLIGSCEKDEGDEATETGDLTARDSARVTRVLLKKQSKNSINEDSDEERLPRNANEEEEEIIDNQRDDILLNNDKFMREARKRMEETRKIMLEKDKGKEKEKKPEVKKDDD